MVAVAKGFKIRDGRIRIHHIFTRIADSFTGNGG